MSSELIDPKGPGVLNLSFILYFFKALLVIFFLGALIHTSMQVHEKRHDLQSVISQANHGIAWRKNVLKTCDNSTSKKTISSSNCADERAQLKKDTAKIAASKHELGEFKNQYYALCVWLPGFVAACLMLIGRYVGFAGLIAIINCAVLAFIPGFNLFYDPAHHVHLGWVILIIILAILVDRYSLYLVLDEPTQKTKEPPSDE